MCPISLNKKHNDISGYILRNLLKHVGRSEIASKPKRHSALSPLWSPELNVELLNEMIEKRSVALFVEPRKNA